MFWIIVSIFRLSTVNFINILRTNFSYEHRFGSIFCIHITRKNSCRNDVRTKNSYIWRWWNWHLFSFTDITLPPWGSPMYLHRHTKKYIFVLSLSKDPSLVLLSKPKQIELGARGHSNNTWYSKAAFLNPNYSKTRFLKKKFPKPAIEDFYHLKTFLEAIFTLLSTKNICNSLTTTRLKSPTTRRLRSSGSVSDLFTTRHICRRTLILGNSN